MLNFNGFNALKNIGNKLADFDEIPDNGKRYTLLGSGNFGYVEKMKSKFNNNIYAIKKINKNSPKFNQINFKRETEITINLKHENLIKLYGYFEDKENIFKYKEIYKDKKDKENLDNITQDVEIYCLVLEYAGNGSLEKHYKDFRKQYPKEHISKNFIINVFKQLLNGLIYLEKNNVIHRDIKPDNILLDLNYNVKISDFGISVLYKKPLSLNGKDIDSKLLTEYTLAGRKDFICPEIERKQHYNFSADIFCAGLSILILMSKEYPITMKVNPMNNGKYRVINDKNMFDYNPYLKELVLKMLNQNKDLRPKAFDALVELELIEKYIKEPNSKALNLCLEAIKNDYKMNVQKYETNKKNNFSNFKNMNNNLNNNILNNNLNSNIMNNKLSNNNMNNNFNNNNLNNNLNSNIMNNNLNNNNLNNNLNNIIMNNNFNNNNMNNNFSNNNMNNNFNNINMNNNFNNINMNNNFNNINMNNNFSNKIMKGNFNNNNMNNNMVNNMNNNLKIFNNFHMNNSMVNNLNSFNNNSINNNMNMNNNFNKKKNFNSMALSNNNMNNNCKNFNKNNNKVFKTSFY